MKKITAKTPKGFRDQFIRELRKIAVEAGYAATDIHATDSPYSDAPAVAWEGPYEWTMWLSGGASLWAGEGFGLGKPELATSNSYVYGEPINSWSMAFYK